MYSFVHKNLFLLQFIHKEMCFNVMTSSNIIQFSFAGPHPEHRWSCSSKPIKTGSLATV